MGLAKNMGISVATSNRIAMLRPILIIGVVFLHTPGVPYVPSELPPGIFNWFAALLKNGVFRGTVPTMSLIAGFLLFNSGLDQAPLKLFRKKFMTLMIPFIIFNIYCFAVESGMNAAFGSVFPDLALFDKTSFKFFTFLFGIYDAPINAPLHFVRDMIVAIVLAPVLGGMLRKCPWIGLVFLAVFFGTNMDGRLIIRSSSLILFYVGGAAAIYKWDLTACDKYAPQMLAIFLLACIATIAFRIDNNTLLVTAAPFLIWPSASLLKGTAFESKAIKLSKYSFFIFAAHIPLIDTSWWFVKNHAAWIPYPVYWIVAPASIVFSLKLFYDFAMNAAPTLFNFTIGARAKGVVLPERRKTVRPAGAPIYSPEMRMAVASR